MKKYILLLGLCVIGFSAMAQNESQFTNFMNNYLSINPAYAGAREVPSFTAIYRNQWMGFEGAPVAQVLSFNTPLLNERVGFGLSILHRTAGITNSWTGSMAYSYDLQVSKDFGVRIGMQGLVRYLGVSFGDPSVVLRHQNDPSTASSMDVDQYFGNFGIGAFATYKQFYFGASVPRLLAMDIGFDETNPIGAQEVPHAYFMAGGMFGMNESIRLRPALLVKYVENAPVDLDINLSFIFEKDASVGLSYRTGGSGLGESIDLLLYYQLNERFGAGLAYDFTISRLARYQTGSFEALMRYDIKSKNRGDLSNPRFF